MKEKSEWKILFSHHPLCPNFDSHTIKIGSIRFCIGCFIGIPSLILGVFLGFLLTEGTNSNSGSNPLSFSNPLPFSLQFTISNTALLIIGILLLCFQLLSLTALTDIKGIKIIQKILIGFGAGFILVSVFFLLNGSILFRVIILIIIYAAGNALVQYMHVRSSKKVCESCENKWNLEICPIDCCYADFPQNTGKNQENNEENLDNDENSKLGNHLIYIHKNE